MAVRTTALLVAAAAALALPTVSGHEAVAAPAVGPIDGCPAPTPLTFDSPTYVDTKRAGGEPLVATLPNGRLLYSAHAGTTHFYAPAGSGEATGAFVENYQGQTYIWTSDDHGRSWQFRPRLVARQGVPASGFSDPEVAIDSAGTVYFSEINLANVAVSSSKDNGSTWELKNFFGAILTDRQWMEADRPGELYFVANGVGGGTGTPPNPTNTAYITKSTDGGRTFATNVPSTTGGPGRGDIRVDKRTGTVYQAHYSRQRELSVGALRQARGGDLRTVELGTVAQGVVLGIRFPALDLDPAGNLYITWDENGSGDRDAGIWFASSVDGARTWSPPVRVNTGENTAIWPWIGVGDEGRLGIAWLEADRTLPGHDAETPGSHGWRIRAAATLSGLGCTASRTPRFSVATATTEPVHRGAICQGGTICQAEAVDRRLGDYFSVEVDSTGRMYAGYSDTRRGGAVSLPAFVRQAGGPSLLVPKSAGTKPTATTGRPAPAVDAAKTPGGSGSGSLAATGPTAQLPLAGGLLLLAALTVVRRRTAQR